MKTLRFFLSALFVALIFTHVAAVDLNDKDEPYLTKEFPMDEQGNLDVRTSGGSITVEGSNSNKVLVEMYVRRNGRPVSPQDADVQERLENFKIDISKSSNTVTASAENKSSNWGRNNISISFTVYVPKAISCKLNTSGGSINIQGVEGEQNLNTSGGSINIKEIDGDMKARTSGGSINVEAYNGILDAHTSGGSINMSKSRGELAVHTSGGSINLDDVSGSVNAHTSGGGIKANILTLEKELTLKTSGGSISAVVPKGLGMNLDLKGNQVNTKLTNFTGEVKKDKVIGSINGGGILVTMATSGGSVNLDYR